MPFASIAAYGYNKIAVWPDWNSDGANSSYLLLDPGSLSPPDGGWYELLQNFLSVRVQNIHEQVQIRLGA